MSTPAPSVRCTPPATLRFSSLPRLLETLPLAERDVDCDMTFELGSLRWIEALPIAVLAAFANDRKVRLGRGGMIYVPQSYGFLQRMDFFKAVGATIPERFQRGNASGRFVPVREVTRTDLVANVAAEIVSTLRVDDDGAARVLRYCVGEIIDNVFVHAASRTNATVCAQHFPNAGRTQVAIVDTGLGFRHTFENLYPGQGLSDRDAITLGLEPYVTSKPQEEFGMYASGYGRLGLGLFIASEMLVLVGGQFLVASGTAMLRKRSKGHAWEDIPHWSGAIVGFEVPDIPSIPYDEASRRARTAADEQLATRPRRG